MENSLFQNNIAVLNYAAFRILFDSSIVSSPTVFRASNITVANNSVIGGSAVSSFYSDYPGTRILLFYLFYKVPVTIQANRLYYYNNVASSSQSGLLFLRMNME